MNDDDITCALWHDDPPDRVSLEEDRERGAAEDARRQHEERLSRIMFERFGGHFDREGRLIAPIKLY